MLRIIKLTGCFAAITAVWIALLQAQLDVFHRTLVLYSPLLAVLAFGAYSVAALLYGVATFRTVPEEAQSLAKEVAAAKADLAKHGIQLTHA